MALRGRQVLGYLLAERTSTISRFNVLSIVEPPRKTADTDVKQELNSRARNGMQVQTAGWKKVRPVCGLMLSCT